MEGEFFMRLVLAIRTFFAVLFDARMAAAVKQVLPGAQGQVSTTPAVETELPRAAESPRRSDAITLLEALQREARLVDIVKEPLGDYTDAQIGAAARDVLGDCLAVLDRFFALKPISEENEGAELEVPASLDPGRYRLTGNISAEPPSKGKLVHSGWLATQCELPTWSGSKQSALVVAPIELEIE
jgi:Domain of unknown function (DUF2760)